MWLIFSFILLFLFSLYLLILRIKKSWKPDMLIYKGRQYIRGGNFFEKGFYIGCEVDIDLDFYIKKESFVDRFFKKVGVAVKHKVDNKEFDDNFYIVTENVELRTYLKNKKEIQYELSTILKICEKNNLKFKGFFFKQNRLWVYILKDKEEHVNTLISHLFNLADIFNQDSKEIKKIRINKKFIFKADVLSAINKATTLSIIVFLFILNFPQQKGYTLEDWGLTKLSIFISALISFIFIIIIFSILKKSSRTHLVIFEILTFGFIIFSFGTHSVLKKINMSYDNSIPNTFIAKLVNKDISTSRGKNKYYLFIRKSYGGIKRVRVISSLYRKFNKNDIVKIYVKKGLFNSSWISDIRKTTSHERTKTRFISEPKIVTINNERVLITKANKEYARNLKEKREKIKALDAIHQKGIESLKNKDYKTAISYFNEGASKDYSKSYQMIGFMYMQGKGVEINQEEALKWFRKAKESSIRANEKDKKKPF